MSQASVEQIEALADAAYALDQAYSTAQEDFVQKTSELNSICEAAEAEAQSAAQAYEEAQALVEELQSEMESLVEQREELTNQLEEAQQALETAQAALEDAESALASCEASETEDYCPNCSGEEADVASAQENVEAAEEQINNITETLNEINTQIDKLQEKIAKASELAQKAYERAEIARQNYIRSKSLLENYVATVSRILGHLGNTASAAIAHLNRAIQKLYAYKGTTAQEKAQVFEKIHNTYGNLNKSAVDRAMNNPYIISKAKEAAERYAQKTHCSAKEKAEYYESMLNIQRNVLENVAKKVTDAYTPQIAKYGMPPKLVFDTVHGTSHLTGDGRELHFAVGASGSSRIHPDIVVTHEMTHWVHHQAITLNPELRAAINQAARSDWNRIYSSYAGNNATDKIKGDASLQLFSNYLYGKNFVDLTGKQQSIVLSVTDTLGSIAGSHEYGCGHSDYSGALGQRMQELYGTRDYYKIQNEYGLSYGEAVANIRVLREFLSDEQVERLFPELNKLVSSLEEV